MYDIAIIGAGPAGAILARELGLRRKVLLADARPLHDPVRKFGYKGKQAVFEDKCCGGLLAPDAKEWLARNKFALPASALDEVQPGRLRGLDLSTSIERVYPTTYINLSRAVFEQWLLSLVPKDVDTLYGYRAAEISREKEGFEITFKAPDGSRLRHKCKILIGADGANSRVRRFIGKEVSYKSRYLAVQDVFGVKPGSSGLSPDLFKEYVAVFHPALTDFYGWIIPKSDRILLGMAMPPQVRKTKQAGEHMDTLKKYLIQAGYDFSGEFRREGCTLLRPSLEDICLGKDGAFLIGEAAGFISPSSAEGYSYAFISAACLAGAILHSNGAERIMRAYLLKSMHLRANIVYKQMKSLVMYSPFLRQLIMHSGAFAKV